MIEALLLLGPTGVGKSPLGDHLERVGWQGRRCVHLDFGAHLRALGKKRLRPPGLGDEDVAVVRRALAAGALLEDDQFPIAAAIVRDFLKRRAVGADDLVVLNGLPRHVGQAQDVEALVAIRAVLHLDADAATVRARIRRDAGGDRGGRADDDEAAVERRLVRFRRRTEPLLARYADRVERLAVEVGTTPEALLRRP